MLIKDFGIEAFIPSTTRSLSHLKKLVDSIDWGGSKTNGVVRRRCLHLLVEGVNNAIFHAHNGDTKKEIGIRIERHCKIISIEIRDRGPGFDLEPVTEPPIDSERGRGLFIIKKLADEVSYSNNTLKMRLYEK